MINPLSFWRNARKTPKKHQSKEMGILNDLRSRVQSVADGLQTGTMVRDVVVQHGEDILDLQKMQLFQGLAANGEEIRPYYSEDLKPSGYFYSVESAGRYAAWKKDAINYPYSVQRNPDAPNLFINGRFHDELGVQFNADSVGVIGTTAYSKGIVAKYGLQTFGLMMPNWRAIFFEYGAYNELMSIIKSTLYGN